MKLIKTIMLQFLVLALVLPRPAGASLLTKLQWKAEKHFGNETKRQVEAEYGFIENPVLSSYVDQVGARMAAVSHRADIPWEFHIVDSDEVNAFAAPGGFVFVTRGLLEEAESDDELAAVVGHEVGHVAAKHGAKNIKKLPFIIAGMSILAGNYGETAARVGGMALSLFQLHYSREDEYEADQLGVRYALDGGYDPAGMESFFAKLEKKDRSGNLGRLEVALSSHPKTPSRIREVRRAGASAETPENVLRVADSYMERYYYREAAEKYRRAIELDPGAARARLGLADALTQLGRYDEARENLALLLEREPENPAALELLRVRLPEAEARYGAWQAPPAALPAPMERELVGVIASVRDALGSFRERRARLDAKIEGMEGEFDAGLPALGETFAAAWARGVAGEDVFNRASYYYSMYLSALRVAGESSREVERDLKETRRRAREALFAVRTRPESARDAEVRRFITAAEAQTAAALDEAEELEDAVAGAVRSRDSMRKEVETLANRLTREDAALGFWEERTMLEREAESLGAVRRGLEGMMEERAASRRAVVEMRAAALNISASLLSPREDAIFRKMLARRFGLDEAALEAARASGGYLDAALSAGMKNAEVKAAPLNREEQTVDGPETLLSPEVVEASRDAAARKLILHLAEMDLKRLTARPDMAARLMPPPDFTGSHGAARPAMESDAALDESEALLRRGEAGEAMKIIHERGRNAPATALAHLLLGVAYKDTDDYDAALKEFGRAEKKGAPRHVVMHLMGNAYLELEAYEDALDRYAKAAAEKGDEPAYLAGAGYALAMTGDEDAAAERFRAALALDPADCGARNNLAILLYEEGLAAESEEEFGKIRETGGGCGGMGER